MKLYKRSSKKAGLSPGTLVHIGEKKTEEVNISMIDYDESQIQEKDAATVGECLPFKEKPTVTWINVSGIHDVTVIEEFGKAFNIHPLLLEDIVHSDQRPKLEDYDDYLFLVLRMLRYDEAKEELQSEQVSLILGPNFVITFQEREGDVFDAVRARIRNGKGKIRKMGCDYLTYALIDSVVDHYFLVFEKYGEKIEVLQDEVLSQPTPETLQVIQRTKRDMIFLRKSVWPLREAINALQRGESSLVTDNVNIYLRDVYDHTIQVIETIETFRDMLSGTLDVYLSSVSNKMNEVMKVLTIIATIFMPMTFIAGIYGMNFKYMPELDWHWAYPVIWAVIIVLGVLMLMGFKRKKWL
ncbi:MAG: magnesium/cobalt transporter CorA, partial [Desulfobacterales bacterium]|nr:magnesium/cobalt transporter CorA [Desulfobacterales bacterium]